MAEVESHSNGNGKHALEDDGAECAVKAKLLKTENGNGVAKQANGNNLKEDETAAAADSTPAVEDEKSVGASNDSTGAVDALQAGDQSNNKSDFNESESGAAVSSGGVGEESNTNTNDLGVTNSSTNDLRNENTNESNGDDVIISGGRGGRRVKELGENSADNYEDDDEDDDDVGPGGEEEDGDEEDDDEVDDDEDDEEADDGEDEEDDGEE